MSTNIETVLPEMRVFATSEAFMKQANVSGMAAYRAKCAEAQITQDVSTLESPAILDPLKQNL